MKAGARESYLRARAAVAFHALSLAAVAIALGLVGASVARSEIFERSVVNEETAFVHRADVRCRRDTTTAELRQSMYPVDPVDDRPDHSVARLVIGNSTQSVGVCRYYAACSLPGEPPMPGFQVRCLAPAVPGAACPAFQACLSANYSQTMRAQIASLRIDDNRAGHSEYDVAPLAER